MTTTETKKPKAKAAFTQDELAELATPYYRVNLPAYTITLVQAHKPNPDRKTIFVQHKYTDKSNPLGVSKSSFRRTFDTATILYIPEGELEKAYTLMQDYWSNQFDKAQAHYLECRECMETKPKLQDVLYWFKL